MNFKKEYASKKVLITGGLGFIGSNLAIKLVESGAKVDIMDANLERYGSNDFNVQQIKKNIQIDFSDIRDKEAVLRNVRDKDIIFSLAAQTDYNYSLKKPILDIDINCKGHLNILESCRTDNPNCRIIFPGSRMQYGKIEKKDLPVKEEHPLNPLSVYAINKIAGENYHKAYNLHYGLDTVVFRIANPYGPRAQIKNPGYCIVNWFIGQALKKKPISIYGEGNQLRDYIYIDDLINAFLISGVHPNPKTKVYNVGSGVGTKFIDMVNTIVNIVGKGKIKHVEWPKNYENVETGDFYADISRIKNELNWKPSTSLESGLEKTIEFYRKNLDKYI